MKRLHPGSKQPVCQGFCMLSFVGVLAPKFLWLGLLRSYSPMLSQLVALLLGWFSWTFVEYILHRFWMHGHRESKSPGADPFNHHHHHTHPTEIMVTTRQRWTGILLVATLLVLSLVIGGWFTFLTGFVIGFVAFLNMHWVLHQEWAKKFVPKLQEQHIHHHLKYPNHAFGVTTRFWDRMFRTTAPRGAVITARIYRFYIDGRVNDQRNP